MKLATRVSAFFLAALGLVLIGNSALLFGVSWYYLAGQLDEQLHAALHTLVAAVEVEEDDVKWEPSDHTVTLGGGNDVLDVRWVVCNERGEVIDHSRDAPAAAADDRMLEIATRRVSPAGDRPGWRFAHYRLAARHPKPVAARDIGEHGALTVVVGQSLSNLHATLSRLAALLVVLPALCWISAATAGRWFCQKAIDPVRRMAKSARTISTADTRARLPVVALEGELWELGTAFNGLLDQLFEAYEQQRRFAGDAAHQLRTPLTVLQGQVQVALRRPRTAEEYESTMRIVEDEVSSLRGTVESLLYLAEPNGEACPASMEAIEFAAWIGQYMLRWQADPRASDLRVEVQPGAACRSSSALLAQLCDVLISNALKYSRAGTPVDVRVTCGEGQLRLEVEDRGIGIAPADRDSVFEPFFRSPVARQSGAQGTGLGLAIGARIAKVLGGSLDFSSEGGVGTRFVLLMPA